MLSEDATQANGACLEMLGTCIESLAAVGAGLGVGFYFSKDQALICLAVAPFFIAALVLELNCQGAASQDPQERGDKAKPARLAESTVECLELVRSLRCEEQLLTHFEKL